MFTERKIKQNRNTIYSGIMWYVMMALIIIYRHHLVRNDDTDDYYKIYINFMILYYSVVWKFANIFLWIAY